MRYLVFLFSGFLLLSVIVLNAKEGKVNFSGEWILNSDESDLGDGGRRRGMMASKMVVEQKGEKLVVESFRTNRDGEEVSTELTYTLDGKECKNEDDFRKTVSVAEWSEDGDILTITSKINISRGGNEFTMESIEKWSMDKKKLIIDSTISTSRGERTRKAVYYKS